MDGRPMVKPRILKRPAAVKTQPVVKRKPSSKSNGGDTDIACRKSPVELLNPRSGRSSSRKVLVLYTGGTIGMQALPNGSLAPVPRALAAQLRRMEELKQERMPECHLVEFSPLLDSADMTPKDWSTIANAIGDNYYEYDGFVVLHGTDTLAYTASALSFMLEQLAKPVVVTGSMLPFCEPVSDARQNLMGSVIFAGLADICEVCVFFSGSLMRGCRTQKLNASSLTAFGSPNYPQLAEQGADIRIFSKRLRDPPRGRFRVQNIDVTDILVLWVTPGFSDEILKPLVHSKTIKGLILLLYGCGNAPARKASFLKVLGDLVKKGVVVAACSQCVQGTVDLEKYAVGKAFHDAGVVTAGDMTVEAACTKMAYLFSKGLSPEQCRKNMLEDLRGALSTQISTLKISEPVTGISSI